MAATTEAFARAKIDALLMDAGWNVTDGTCVLFEQTLPDGTRSDYVLCDRAGRPMAALEAKHAGIDPVTAQDQGRHYAEQLQVPFVFLSNGEEVWFLDRETDAHARKIAGFYSQDDLERRIATRQIRRDLSTVETDRRIVDRYYQIECIDTLCTEISLGRRSLLVEMATGTGKTRTAAAFIKRLFEAGVVTRVLFLVDRIALAGQAEDAFTDHLRDYPCHVLRPGRGFDRAKRITIATLQTMIAEYRELSPGYFDLVITDECHRSIYGKWSGVLRHFDGIQLGLTATPCTVQADELPDPEDGQFVRDTLRFFGLEEPTFRYTLREAIDAGHLVPYRIFKAMTVKTAADGGFQVRRDELDWSAMDESARQEFEALFGQADPITVDPRALERKFTIPERNRAMVREFRDCFEKGFMGKDGVRRTPTWGKTIVFAVTKRHAETLAVMFDEHFADLKPDPATRFADFVVSDVGGGPAPDAGAIIKRFKEEPFPQILVSVNMLDTGFDCPEVVNLVMARFTRSAILYRQMRGRGTRKAEHIGKKDFTMFDFVGVTDFHGDDDEDIAGDLTKEAGTHPIDPTPRMLLTLDVDDHIDPTTREWLTLDENGRIILTQEHEARASEIGLRVEAWRTTREFTAEQARWASLIGRRVMADAMHLEPFGDYDLDEHPFDALGGYDQARRVFGGADVLADLIAGFNAVVLGSGAAADTAPDGPEG
ncbi:MAG: restriction endonuclease subunit R [Gammaproteobacteria bacterium]|nr:restriction endonuclease subunit R [Gammaproteobacteria bacterium]MYE51423.1 restriction endonuclease subunit R [Gammaproteobacteria bacterium]MYF51333.1 restriction endonuclease subunit R [Gammaproteobacteria bacterium]